MGSVGASFQVSLPEAWACRLKNCMRTLNNEIRSDRGLYVGKRLDNPSINRANFSKTLENRSIGPKRRHFYPKSGKSFPYHPAEAT